MAEDTASMNAASAQVMSTAINSFVAGAENEKARKFGKEMAEWQWNKNIEAWNMQNAYNTPEAQMQRFEDAGLNPALIYGRGEPGQAGGIAPFQAPEGRFGMPEIDLASAFSLFQDIKQKAAQTDNIKKQNLLIEEQFNTQMLENLNRIRHLAYDSGGPVNNLELGGKYWYDPDLPEQHGNLYHQYDANKADAEMKARQNQIEGKYSEVGRSIEVAIQQYAKNAAAMANKRMEETQGRTMPSDSYGDRTFEDMFGKFGTAGKGATQIMQFLLMLKSLNQ